MIAQLKNALARAVHDPLYIWYLWQNIDIIRDHFPELYHAMQKSRRKRRSLDLGEKSGLSRLHVILRTTDFVMNLNSSRQLENIGITTKSDVIRDGGCSIFPAAAKFSGKYGRDAIRITLVIDRLSDRGIEQYRNAARAVGLDFDVVEANGNGNGPTFQTQIDIALRDSDDTLVLILEDDYQLDPESLVVCFDVMRNHGNVIGMNPHFHPDRIRFQDIGKLTVISGRLFCRVSSTCCTFFMPARQIRRFKRCLRLYDGFEKGSVSVAWRRGLCVAPLGWTLAEHLHRSDLSPVSTIHKFLSSKNTGE